MNPLNSHLHHSKETEGDMREFEGEVLLVDRETRTVVAETKSSWAKRRLPNTTDYSRRSAITGTQKLGVQPRWNKYLDWKKKKREQASIVIIMPAGHSLVIRQKSVR